MSYNINIAKCFALSVLALLSSISCTANGRAVSSEAVYFDAVRDSRGNFVTDSNGNCVRTKWSTSEDPCLVKINYKQDGKEIIMKMDERKIFFDFDKANLKEGEKAKLQKVAKVIEDHNIEMIKVVGYTDRIGTATYNQKLSERRANAVKHYLDSLVAIPSNKVELRGLGKTHQLKLCSEIKNRDELIKCLAPNRRVEVEVDYLNNK